MNTRASVRSASDITMAVDPDAIKVIFLEALNEDGTANKLLEVLKPTLDRLTEAIQEQTLIIQSQKRDLEKKRCHHKQALQTSRYLGGKAG